MSGDEWAKLSCPAHPRDNGCPGNPTPCCALSGIPSWRPQGAGPVAVAAAHQCRARRGPHPAELCPRSPAVRTGEKERLSWAGRRRAQTAKLVQPDVQPYPVWGVGGHTCWAWLCVSLFPPVHYHLLRAKWGQLHITQAPHHTHSRSLEWGQSKHLAEWDKQVGRGGGGGSRLNLSLTKHHPQRGGRGPVLPEAHPAHGQWQPRLWV